MYYIQFSCLILSIIVWRTAGESMGYCARVCCPNEVYDTENGCTCGSNQAPRGTCACLANDLEICRRKCSPEETTTCELDLAPRCGCLPNGAGEVMGTCQRHCCPFAVKYESTFCDCDENVIVAHLGICDCVTGERNACMAACGADKCLVDLNVLVCGCAPGQTPPPPCNNCQNSCCPRYGVCTDGHCQCQEGMADPAVCPLSGPRECNDLECHTSCCPKWGACDPDKGNTCQCVDGMDHLPSVARYCQNGEDCQDYQCQMSCCPKWGACEPQMGTCHCIDGTEDLEEVQKQCNPGGKPCTEAEVEYCQQSCLVSPEESGYVFAFAECTRGSDGSAQCNCQPYQG